MKHVLHTLPVAASLLLSTALFAQTAARPTFIAPSYVYEGLKQHAADHTKSPIAVNETITGVPRQSVSGNVLKNARDPQGKRLTVFLVSSSPDGSLGIADDGDFTFTPDKNFTGNSTSFSYKVCNGSLCSETATVTLNFPASTPVILNDFTANCDADNNVKLNWNTDAETGNDHFDIERSTDGINFTKVGSVAGQNNAGAAHNYSFTQKVSRQTAGKSDLYYRVKLVTATDTVAASKILIARVYKTKTLQLLSVTPNPTVNDIRVNAQLNESAYIVIKVMNQSGKELIRQSVKSPEGMNSYTLEGSSRLEKGIYLLEMIVNSNERMIVQLIKD